MFFGTENESGVFWTANQKVLTV